MDQTTPTPTPRPRPPRRGLRRVAAIGLALFLLVPVGVGTAPQPAGAASRCPAFVTWETVVGTRRHAYVDFRASDTCNGRHVRRANVRLIRRCGPYFDTGRIYTSTAPSRTNTALRSVSVWIYDSPIWECRTDAFYNYETF